MNRIWRFLALMACVILSFGVAFAYGFEPNELPPTVSTVKPITPTGTSDEPQNEAVPNEVVPTEASDGSPASSADIAQRETKLAEREKAVEEREKAVEKREAALTDWYTKLSEYREYLNGFQVKSEAKQESRQTVVRPTYSTYVRPAYQNYSGTYGGYSGSTCANGQCYGGW